MVCHWVNSNFPIVMSSQRACFCVRESSEQIDEHMSLHHIIEVLHKTCNAQVLILWFISECSVLYNYRHIVMKLLFVCSCLLFCCCTHAHMHTCTCTHAHLHTWHMHTCIPAHAHLHTCTHAHCTHGTCTHAHLHMHTCTPAHMHTWHMHTCTQRDFSIYDTSVNCHS